MAFLNKNNIKNVHHSKVRVYNFDGNLEKLKTGDLCIRKNGVIEIVIRNGDICNFNFFSNTVLYDNFWLVIKCNCIVYSAFKHYTAYDDYEIEKIYSNAFTLEDIKKIASFQKEQDAKDYIYRVYKNLI